MGTLSNKSELSFLFFSFFSFLFFSKIWFIENKVFFLHDIYAHCYRREAILALPYEGRYFSPIETRNAFSHDCVPHSIESKSLFRVKCSSTSSKWLSWRRLCFIFSCIIRCWWYHLGLFAKFPSRGKGDYLGIW